MKHVILHDEHQFSFRQVRYFEKLETCTMKLHDPVLDQVLGEEVQGTGLYARIEFFKFVVVSALQEMFAHKVAPQLLFVSCELRLGQYDLQEDSAGVWRWLPKSRML